MKQALKRLLSGLTSSLPPLWSHAARSPSTARASASPAAPWCAPVPSRKATKSSSAASKSHHMGIWELSTSTKWASDKAFKHSAGSPKRKKGGAGGSGTCGSPCSCTAWCTKAMASVRGSGAQQVKATRPLGRKSRMDSKKKALASGVRLFLTTSHTVFNGFSCAFFMAFYGFFHGFNMLIYLIFLLVSLLLPRDQPGAKRRSCRRCRRSWRPRRATAWHPPLRALPGHSLPHSNSRLNNGIYHYFP